MRVVKNIPRKDDRITSLYENLGFRKENRVENKPLNQNPNEGPVNGW